MRTLAERIIDTLHARSTGLLPQNFDNQMAQDVDWMADRYQTLRSRMGFSEADRMAKSEWVAMVLSGKTLDLPVEDPVGPDERGFVVQSPCGRAWFVSIESVHDDYAKYLEQEDSLSPEVALAAANQSSEFIPSWFYEQFNWDDVIRLGRLIKQPAADDIPRILEEYRVSSRSGVLEDCTSVPISKRE